MWNVEGGRKAQGIKMTDGQCIDFEKKETVTQLTKASTENAAKTQERGVWGVASQRFKGIFQIFTY